MGIPVMGTDKVMFILAEGKTLVELEADYGVKQADVVNDLIERTCWGDSEPLLQPYHGNVGSDVDRLAAIRRALAIRQQ